MDDDSRIDWYRSIPFALMHLGCCAVIWVGWSWTAVAVAALLYAARVFALTAFYHRYFSHRSFKTTRWFSFLCGLLGNAAAQRGPIWWAAHHRNHHRSADTPQDAHSPRMMGFLRSHMLWFLTRANYRTNERAVPDLVKRPELRFIDRFDYVGPLLLGLATFGLGALLHRYAPQLGTDGWQMFVWGFFLSTVAVYHVTYSINSIAHRFGTRRFETRDDSRNNLWLALAAFGEGWHNNHHFYPGAARQGFYWWEIDITYYLLVVLSWVRLVWDLKPVPERVLKQGREVRRKLQSS
jgi:stearoyl-CoA desaturase (delta-9 desaturase)